MKDIRECFIGRSKQLSLCIMGRKYMGGLEQKAQLKRKQKLVPAEMTRKEPDDEDDTSLSSKEGRSTIKGHPN